MASMVFTVACAVLLADLIINDIMPQRFVFKAARSYRWLCLSSMAIVYWLFGTIALLPGASPPGSWVLIASYFGVGAWAMTFAFQTKVARYHAQVSDRMPLDHHAQH